MVDPDWMGGEELRSARGDPVREAVICFLGGVDLPAHDYEHYVPTNGQAQEVGGCIRF